MPEVRYQFKNEVSEEDRTVIREAMISLASTLENMATGQMNGVCGITVSRNRGKFGKTKRIYELEIG